VIAGLPFYPEDFLIAFFDHFLAAAHQRDATGIFRSETASAGFFHRQFQVTGTAIIQVTLFHVRTICHYKTSFGCYCGAIKRGLTDSNSGWTKDVKEVRTKYGLPE
jgi:hypothetical protein